MEPVLSIRGAPDGPRLSACLHFVPEEAQPRAGESDHPPGEEGWAPAVPPALCWLLLPCKAHRRHLPLPEGGKEAAGREQSARGTGQTPPRLSAAPSISLFPFPPRHVQLSLYDSPALSSPSSRGVALRLQSVSRLPSTAALPSNPSFLTPPRTGKQDSPQPPASGLAPTCPPSPAPLPQDAHSHGPAVPPLPSPPAARGSCRGVSPLGRFSSARHVWVLCPALTSSPHASSI